VAKLHKLGERQETPDRLVDKDAYDVYRLLVAIPTDNLAMALTRLLADQLAGEVTQRHWTSSPSCSERPTASARLWRVAPKNSSATPPWSRRVRRPRR
jgi:hypothetical protein